MSELENQVIQDMVSHGFNPFIEEHVRKYWEERLS
jgi:hypothetical protein